MSRSRTLWLATVALALLLPSTGGSAEAEGALPWPSAVMAEPLELARRVRAEGDIEVLSRLDDTHSRRVRMQAIAATRWMSEPDLALPALAELAGGSDPDLAPAATLAAFQVATSLERASMDSREANLEALSPARAALGALTADETARADLRRLAAFAEDSLEHLGVR